MPGGRINDVGNKRTSDGLYLCEVAVLEAQMFIEFRIDIPALKTTFCQNAVS